MSETITETTRNAVRRNPWLWVPSLYLAESIPYTMAMTVSVVLYKDMGLSNTQIAFYTSWLYLPWVIKPLWSPFVDIFRTKRFWILAMQLAIGASFAGVALDAADNRFCALLSGCFLDYGLQLRHTRYRRRRFFTCWDSTPAAGCICRCARYFLPYCHYCPLKAVWCFWPYAAKIRLSGSRRLSLSFIVVAAVFLAFLFITYLHCRSPRRHQRAVGQIKKFPCGIFPRFDLILPGARISDHHHFFFA